MAEPMQDDADGKLVATERPDALRAAFAQALGALMEALPPGASATSRSANWWKQANVRERRLPAAG